MPSEGIISSLNQYPGAEGGVKMKQAMKALDRLAGGGHCSVFSMPSSMCCCGFRIVHCWWEVSASLCCSRWRCILSAMLIGIIRSKGSLNIGYSVLAHYNAPRGWRFGNRQYGMRMAVWKPPIRLAGVICASTNLFAIFQLFGAKDSC